MKILFTGGGTGGHVYPIIAIKSEVEKTIDNHQIRFFYLGPDSFAKTAFKKEELQAKFILAGKFRRYFSLANFIDLLKIPIGFIQSLWHLFQIMPDVVFSKGGYGSFPVVLASWLYRIPVIIHESDSVPGLSNKLLARFARKVIVSFSEATDYFPKKKTTVLGNPVRKELLDGDKEKARKIFNLISEKPVILIMGGSQGARRINQLVLNTLPRLLEKYELIHICGKNNFKFIQQEKEKLLHSSGPNRKGSYHIYPFLSQEKLKHAYAVSDLIISRAGAGGIFEIAAVGKPSILIPLSNSASNHQAKNAQALTSLGGAVALEENNLTMNLFLSNIFEIADNPQKAQEMGDKAKSFYKSDNNQKIAEEILKLCQ